MIILRAATGVMGGFGATRTAGDQRRFSRGDGVLIECRLRQVPAYLCQIFEAEFVGAVGTVPDTLLLHAIPPNRRAASSQSLRAVRPYAAINLSIAPRSKAREHMHQRPRNAKEKCHARLPVDIALHQCLGRQKLERKLSRPRIQPAPITRPFPYL